MAPRVVVFNNMITPYTNRLYNELVARGMDLAVLSCTAQEPDRRWAQSISPRYECRTVPDFPLPVSRSRYTHVNFGIGRALRALDPDVLIVNGFFPSMLTAALWAGRRRITLALTIDGWAETMPDTIYHRLVRPWLLARCRAVICCSLKGQDYFRGQGVEAGRLALVPLVPAWEPPSRVTPFDDRTYDILWCARINDDKNAIFFENVVSHLHESMPGLSVRVIGSGPAEQRMMSHFAAEQIAVIHDQYVPWYDIAKVFEQCRVMMLPSLLDSWGLVCNEAMQCGTPCMATRHVGAAGELVRHGENGLICDLVVDDWVDAAEQLLKSRDRWMELSTNARDAAVKVTLNGSATAFSDVINRLSEGQDMVRGLPRA